MKVLFNAIKSNIPCVFFIVTVVIITIITSCNKPASNEISEMTDKCFQHRQAIKIEFTPIPELAHDGKEEKIK